jgi:rhodanese-related sulfurtransferase
MSNESAPTVSAKELHELLQGPEEYALLDVREPRLVADEGSILLGVSAPASNLELTIAGVVPRRSTPIVLLDGGANDLADWAARRLILLGYTDVRVLDGGIQAWSDAGFRVHTGGTHVVGQAFGEFIEDVYKTPHLTVGELREKVAAGEDVVILDSRPLTEFEVHSLPGGTSIPGAELVYRASEVVPSSDSLVVVNCAGRTRSIIGAQALINAGLPNRVVALEGGTQSWILEGFELEHGKTDEAPFPSPEGIEQAKVGARRIADRFGVKSIGVEELRHFRDEAGIRSLYLLDIRSPGEYELGHLPGSHSTPSWEVAPWIFRHVATHNARIVLIDDPDLVRATVSASWIIQIGWGDVFVIGDALGNGDLEVGPEQPTVLGLPRSGIDVIDAGGLEALRREQPEVQIVDLQQSTTFREGHIAGAWFAIRSRLLGSLGEIPGVGPIVLTSEDGILARIAAPELTGATDRRVAVLDGGTKAWKQRGLALEAGDQHFLHEPNDVMSSPWYEEDPERQKEGFRRYLAWEVGLVEQLSQDDTVNFKIFA